MKKDKRKYYIIIVNENIEKIIETHDTEIKALQRLDFIGSKWNTTTGTDLKIATGYAFASMAPDGFYYVIKETNSWSATTVGIISMWGTLVSGGLSGGSGGGGTVII